jgi:hypothetical protein
MTGIKTIAILAGAIIVLLAITASILYLLRKHIRPAVFTLQKNCCILVSDGKKPICFDSSKAAADFIKKCSLTEVNWEVYTICNGKVINLGNYKDLKQIEI